MIFKLLIVICIITMLQKVSSKPVQPANTVKPKNTNHIIIKVPTTKSTTVKTFAVSDNGAFAANTLINRHASAHKTIKNRVDTKKTFEGKKPLKKLPMICMQVVSTEKPTTETYDAVRKAQPFSPFMSRNWGNQK